MDLTTLQPVHSPNSPADQQLSLSESASSVRSSFNSGRTMPGSAKAIGQRSCTVERLNNADRSDSDRCDFSPDHYAADRLPAVHQQTPEPQDSDGPWQVVTRRHRSRRKQQQSPVVSDRRVKTHGASARQLPDSSSAGYKVGGQQQGLQVNSNDPVSPLSRFSYWPICRNCFARLGALDWRSFHACQMRFQWCLNITEDDFLRIQHMISRGAHASWGADDVVFLAGPFKVLLSHCELSADAVFLSLFFECTVSGFVSLLGERFVSALSGVSRKHQRLFFVIAQLLASICREECWQERLGWQKLSMRDRCHLFSSMAFLFKQSHEKSLIQNLNQQVSGAWLEKHYYATLQRISCDTVRRDPQSDLRDLKASVRAVFSWLEAQIFSVGKPQERSGLIVRYADICDALVVGVDSLATPPRALLFSLWQAVAKWSVRFRMYLSQYLGFDRTISLLDKLLKKIDRWSGLDPLAFELRLCLLESMLTKCEELKCRRNSVLFSQAWYEYEKKLELLLAECHRFMADYQPPFAIEDESNYAQIKEDARLNLKLRESVFYRLDCEIRRSTRQCILENLHICRRAFEYGWSLNRTHRAVGAIELTKWYFLAGEHDTGVSHLMDIHCEHARLSWKKAILLARHGEFRGAVDELRRTKALATDSDKVDQHKRDRIDGQIAMTLLHWYEAEADTDHLISAYLLSVDLLGHCDVQDREAYEGSLVHIVNAMKQSGLRFEDYAGPTSVLGYLLKDGCSIKSWHHFSDLLYIRHKMRLTSVDSVNKLADEVGVNHRLYIGIGKRA